MDVLVAGGTEKILGGFLNKLRGCGINPRWHWEWHVRNGALPFPADAEGVVVIKNMIGHRISDRAKEEAQRNGVDVALVTGKFSLAYPILEQMGWVELDGEEPLNEEGVEDMAKTRKQGSLLAVVLEAITLLVDENPSVLLDQDELCKRIPALIEIEVEGEALKDLVKEVLSHNDWLYRNNLSSVQDVFPYYEDVMGACVDRLGDENDLIGLQVLGMQSFRKFITEGHLKAVKLGPKFSGRWYTTKQAVLDYIRKHLIEMAALDMEPFQGLEFTVDEIDVALLTDHEEPTEAEIVEPAPVEEEDEVIVSKQAIREMAEEAVTAALGPVNDKLTVLEGSFDEFKANLAEEMVEVAKGAMDERLTRVEQNLAELVKNIESIRESFSTPRDNGETIFTKEDPQDFQGIKNDVAHLLEGEEDWYGRLLDLENQINNLESRGNSAGHGGGYGVLKDLVAMGAKIIIEPPK